MNCQQLARVLDEVELHELPEGERAAARDHLAACAACASDHDMHLRVAALPIAPLSAERIAGWRALASPGAMAARDTVRARGRFLLVGALAAVAAASALLVTALRGEPDAAPGLATSAPAVHQAEPFVAIPVAGAPAPATQAGRKESVPSSGTVPAAPSFTVLVQSLQYESDDGTVQAAAQRFYDALVEELRALPAVTVIGPRQLVDTRDATADFVLTGGARDHAPMPPSELSGKTTAAGGQWQVMLRLAIRSGDSRRVQPIRVAGYLAETDCLRHVEGLEAAHCNTATAVRNSLELMRMLMFPADPALQGELRNLLLDSSRPVAERSEALEQLAVLVRRRGGHGPVLDADVVHAALALMETARDDAMRLDYWRQLRGLAGPEVVGALVEATARHHGNDLRLEAASQLAAHFPADAAARAALQWLAENDPDARVRAVAQGVTRPAPDAATGF